MKEECGNIFQSTFMTPAYSEVLNFKAYIIVAHLKGEIVGGILTYRRSLPKLPFVNELYTSYGPIVSRNIKKSTTNEIIYALLRATMNLANTGTTKHTFFVRSDCINYQEKESYELCGGLTEILQGIGYRRVSDGYAQTFILDLTKDLTTILSGFEKRARWALKKAKRLDVKVFSENTLTGLSRFFELYLVTAKRHGSIVTPFDFLKGLYYVLAPQNMMDIYFAYYDNIPISASIVLNHKNIAYYYMSASLKEYNYTQANTLLQFQMISKMKDRGIREYDLLCAPSSNDKKNPQYGLYLFKKSFGGRCVPVLNYECVFNKLLNVSKDRLIHTYTLFQGNYANGQQPI